MNSLKLHRLLRELSQEALARRAGLSQGTYSRIERQVRSASIEERSRIAKALGVPPELVFGDERTARPASRGCRR